MPTKSQSPPTTSQPTTKVARSRKATDQSDNTSAARAGSQGGIKLEKERTSKAMSSPAPKTTKTATTLVGKDAATPASSTGPNRQRRRPRKLNKEPTSTQNATPSSIVQAASGPPPSASTTELEALKSRVRGLEAKVEELYNNGADTRSARSPRRRGRGKKGSSTQASAGTTRVEPEEEEADEELVRLEGELETARRDLESYHPPNRPRTKRSVSEDTEYIEEIPREGGIGIDDTVNTGDRQVTLTGNYRIPLPSSVSMADVKNIQSGVSAAQNVARSFLEQRRAQQALNTPQQKQSSTRSTRTASTTSKAKSSSSMEVAKGGEDKQSWSEWFGGYSMAISRAVQNIEAEAAIESQSTGSGTRPTQGRRTASTPSSKKASANATPSAKSQQRPGMKARQTNLSSQQVHGLME